MNWKTIILFKDEQGNELKSTKNFIIIKKQTYVKDTDLTRTKFIEYTCRAAQQPKQLAINFPNTN